MKQLVDQAAESAGSSDFGADTWQVGLERLVDSLNNEAALNELGAAIVAGELSGYLRDRAEITAYRAAHTDIANVDVLPPIVIIGQGRTGTTILFDLLAQDPEVRVPRTWEVDKPVPP